MRRQWLRVVLAVLMLASFGACLVHADDEAEDHLFAPHACAAMLALAPSAAALTMPPAGPFIAAESPLRPANPLLQPLDPPPKVLALA
jgi:hypothetical protein